MNNCHLQALLDYLGIDWRQIAFVDATQPIENMRIDSRKIKPNDLFIALKGHHVDGHSYIHQAIDAGAALVLSETANQQDDNKITYVTTLANSNVPVIAIYRLNEKLSKLADIFYQHPSEHLTLVGVTGTNGKTTIAQLLAQWVSRLGQKTAVMGTIGNGLYGELTASENTTMSAVDVQSTLADFVKKQVDFTAMEVSSHGLVEYRVAEVSFDAAIFTNLSRDHLDYHGTMENYAKAKWSLFDVAHRAVKRSGKAIINIDDDTGQQWIKNLPNAIAVSADLTKACEMTKYSDFVGVKHISYHSSGASIDVMSSWGDVHLESPLIGEFNVANLLAVLGTLLALGYPLDSLSKTVNELRPVQGRMEMFYAEQKPMMIVDYAHTPDALIKALKAARLHCKGELWVIFGCGGDRDNGKRPLMAAAAESYADRVMVSNDNPRTEDEKQIVADILVGFEQADAVLVEFDRMQAIKQVLTLAKANDTILIAGKGHEDYQIVGTNKRHYSDRETVATLLGVQI